MLVVQVAFATQVKIALHVCEDGNMLERLEAYAR